MLGGELFEWLILSTVAISIYFIHVYFWVITTFLFNISYLIKRWSNHPRSGGSPSNLNKLSTVYLFISLNFFPIVCVKFPSFFLISKIHGHKKHKKSSGSLPSLVPRWCPLRSLLLLNRGLPGYWIWMWRTSNIWHRWPGLQPPPHETAGCSFFGTLGESWCSEHGLELITNLPYKWNIRVI